MSFETRSRASWLGPCSCGRGCPAKPRRSSRRRWPTWRRAWRAWPSLAKCLDAVIKPGEQVISDLGDVIERALALARPWLHTGDADLGGGPESARFETAAAPSSARWRRCSSAWRGRPIPVHGRPAGELRIEVFSGRGVARRRDRERWRHGPGRPGAGRWPNGWPRRSAGRWSCSPTASARASDFNDVSLAGPARLPTPWGGGLARRFLPPIARFEQPLRPDPERPKPVSKPKPVSSRNAGFRSRRLAVGPAR